MYIGIILKAVVLKDVKAAAEELTAGAVAYTQLLQINFGYELANRLLSIFIPLVTAYMVHKLKKNYWELDRPFFSNIVKDIQNWIKENKKK